MKTQHMLINILIVASMASFSSLVAMEPEPQRKPTQVEKLEGLEQKAEKIRAGSMRVRITVDNQTGHEQVLSGWEAGSRGPKEERKGVAEKIIKPLVVPAGKKARFHLTFGKKAKEMELVPAETQIVTIGTNQQPALLKFLSTVKPAPAEKEAAKKSQIYQYEGVLELGNGKQLISNVKSTVKKPAHTAGELELIVVLKGDKLEQSQLEKFREGILRVRFSVNNQTDSTYSKGGSTGKKPLSAETIGAHEIKRFHLAFGKKGYDHQEIQTIIIGSAQNRELLKFRARVEPTKESNVYIFNGALSIGSAQPKVFSTKIEKPANNSAEKELKLTLQGTNLTDSILTVE